eukprot:gene8574-8756_t
MIGIQRNDVAVVSEVDCEQQRQLGKAVLCSIENIVVHEAQTPSEGVRSPMSKKQRPTEQANATPWDADFLFAKARSVLRQPPNDTSEAPIGREQQASLLQKAICSFADTGRGKSVYVSGLPGTVTSAADVYSQVGAAAAGQNGISIASSSSCCLDGQCHQSTGSTPSQELDQTPEVRVLLIGIANSIDLTERMLPELKLKMVSPTLICFPAYTSKQLTNILTACVAQLPCK